MQVEVDRLTGIRVITVRGPMGAQAVSLVDEVVGDASIGASAQRIPLPGVAGS